MTSTGIILPDNLWHRVQPLRLQGLAELMRGLLQLDAQPAGEGNKENFRAPPEFSWSNLRIGTSHTASSHLSVSPGNKKEQVLTRAVPKVTATTSLPVLNSPLSKLCHLCSLLIAACAQAGATVHESLPPTEQPQRGALGMTLMPSSPLDQMQADITANGTEVIESNDPLAVLIGRAERLRSAMNVGSGSNYSTHHSSQQIAAAAITFA